MWLGVSWNGRCDGKKLGSCMNLNQSLNAPALNCLRVVLFDFAVLGVLWQWGFEIWGLHNIQIVLITGFRPVLMVHLR